MWGFFGGQQKIPSAGKEGVNVAQDSPRREGIVDMTSLDITYITHRLVGEFECLPTRCSERHNCTLSYTEVVCISDIGKVCCVRRGLPYSMYVPFVRLR